MSVPLAKVRTSRSCLDAWLMSRPAAREQQNAQKKNVRNTSEVLDASKGCVGRELCSGHVACSLKIKAQVLLMLNLALLGLP